jgi:hypothetical protein
MPPVRVKNKQESFEQDGKILLAIKALQNEDIPYITAAARVYNVPRSTLRDRVNGALAKPTTRGNRLKLTQLDEKVLTKWVVSMNDRGAAPRPPMVRTMANLLLAATGNDVVGKCWVTNFIKRTPEIQTRFSRRYNYSRALQEDPRIIRGWFKYTEDTITQYGILSEDIYNFDETGFAMGLVSSAKVVTRAEYYGRRSVIQPRNREWVTTIEAINACGWVLPPTIIFKGKRYLESWFSMDIPDD